MNRFEELIEKDIDERATALFEIEKVLFTKRYNLSKKHTEIFSVQSISMIYAIWEGFIQTSFCLLADEINTQNIHPENLKEELYIHHMESTFKQLNEYPNKSNKKISFFNKLKEFFGFDVVRLKSGVNTQSNISYEVLNGILKSYCLIPFPEHWSIYSYPNTSLKDSLSLFLRYRNGVAHGGDISSEEKVTQEVFDRYKKLVLNLMYEIQIKMNEAQRNTQYLK
ncbi:MAG: hypothetical protein B7X86_14420 [Sphingobacteriales bacterium 17-39-43]|uniref:MAE_28990/MAE_18760 family HEPN-like nuclease n=1 Tax=Daejeonella sp. TaxID=2805397 RepID=UPI000BD0F14A|nr:MAE_28990/MAE_18760 family HEPN-like nuclease [Daejeonella sp.]OYZ30142.1 MAG: hypothetical protein B7Y24_14185 [Sphingobacteriales bacterium 16-39-50]OZA22860.1 MAG: hypothetical protein B7X86_14420 [Sphingobacteriales bacterium 17-39-43]HQT23988.1 MAE_28990/MAE_18760 family HEPN-like nuclease [Daejeonella sp.]HQT58652.1 MAE_28990/MAE_18760 family HEPN-like nuclease [Daejeonella sp.]